MHAGTRKDGDISIHTPVKGVTRALESAPLVAVGISIHTPVKGVTVDRLALLERLCISIHTPVKGVTVAFPDQRADLLISIHTPVKGVTALDGISHPDVPISIHTPVKGVTTASRFSSQAGRRFQSTHPWRVWRPRRDSRRHSWHFNPHTREGCDSPRSAGSSPRSSFQSTHPWRVWPPSGILSCNSNLFQSTHPWRVWLMAGLAVLRLKRFQSTHPWRVWRRYHDDHRPDWGISIHTPVKGVTQPAIAHSDQPLNFNPHTREGCDSESVLIIDPVADFNPHTREGCDGMCLMGNGDGCIFQSTHPWRVWHSDYVDATRATQFQSTHPWRVWQHFG